MKCPGCGYLSFDSFDTCKRCGAQITAATGPAAPSDRSTKKASGIDQDATQQFLFQELGHPPAEEGVVRESRRRAPRRTGAKPGRPEAPARGEEPSESAPVRKPPPPAAEAPARVFDIEDSGFGGGGSQVIDREDDVPERYWDPEIVGWGRRFLALLIDQALLAGLLSVFFLGAYLALWLSDFDMGYFLAPAGFKATFFPFALLAALLSLIYHVSLQARTGQTPGKALAGLEIRTSEGMIPSGGRATLRWFAAALGLACAGVGILWAFFEPRRRGWADLLSKTTIAARRRADHERFR